MQSHDITNYCDVLHCVFVLSVHIPAFGYFGLYMHSDWPHDKIACHMWLLAVTLDSSDDNYGLKRRVTSNSLFFLFTTPNPVIVKAK